MKLQPDRVASQNIISSCKPDVVLIGEQTWTHSVVLPSQAQAQSWNVRNFESLDRSHFDVLAQWQPEIILFGSGQRLRFPQAEWLQTLMLQRIGIETMDTAAACRTYNLLLAEGRNVLAALLIEAPG